MTFADIIAGYEDGLTAGNFDSASAKSAIGGIFIRAASSPGRRTAAMAGSAIISTTARQRHRDDRVGEDRREVNARPGTNDFFSIEAPILTKFQHRQDDLHAAELTRF